MTARPTTMIVLGVAVALAVGFTTAPALAGDPPRQPARVAAKKRAQDAAAHYKIGRFAEALTDYTAAYDLAPVPEILFNIGQCHFQLGRFDRAIFFYERYLADRPRAPNRSTVESLIAEARQNVDRQRARPGSGGVGSLVPSTAMTGDRGGQAPAMELDASIDAGARGDERRPVYRRWWFWTAVGVAALAAGATAYVVTSDGPAELPDRSLGTLDAR